MWFAKIWRQWIIIHIIVINAIGLSQMVDIKRRLLKKKNNKK